MGRCVQLLCVWCLLSKVKALRFNYQKMFAGGSVPWKAPQGRGCRCPLCSWAGGQMGTFLSRELTAQRVPAHSWGQPRDSELQHFHLLVGGSADCCSVTPAAPLGSLWPPVMQEAGPAGDSFSFSLRKSFPPASALTHVTQAFDHWERWRSWWSCQSASPINR